MAKHGFERGKRGFHTIPKGLFPSPDAETKAIPLSDGLSWEIKARCPQGPFFSICFWERILQEVGR